jgi:hypothetical protein
MKQTICENLKKEAPMKARCLLLMVAIFALPFTAAAVPCLGPDCKSGIIEEYSFEFEYDLPYYVSTWTPWIKQADLTTTAAGNNKILTAELEFYVTDDGDVTGERIIAYADFQPLLGVFGEWEVLSGNTTEYEGLAISPLVFSDGKVWVSILGCDFTLKGVEIEGTYCAPVPEPATMMLFGAGLLGLGGYVRRRIG